MTKSILEPSCARRGRNCASPSLLLGVIYYRMNAFEQRLMQCCHLGGFHQVVNQGCGSFGHMSAFCLTWHQLFPMQEQNTSGGSTLNKLKDNYNMLHLMLSILV